MSAREWKHGDLATISGDMLVFTSTGWRGLVDGLKIPNQHIEIQQGLRPLAVIDPEAEIPDEWVDAFESACASAELDSGLTDHDVLKSGLAALVAHIAAPPEPKPDEPTGDRATVRDRDGVLWTRLGTDTYEKPWGSGDGASRAWSDLDVPADGVLWGGVE